MHLDLYSKPKPNLWVLEECYQREKGKQGQMGGMILI